MTSSNERQMSECNGTLDEVTIIRMYALLLMILMFSIFSHRNCHSCSHCSNISHHEARCWGRLKVTSKINLEYISVLNSFYIYNIGLLSNHSDATCMELVLGHASRPVRNSSVAANGLLYFFNAGKSAFFNMVVAESDPDPDVRKMPTILNDFATNELSMRSCS